MKLDYSLEKDDLVAAIEQARAGNPESDPEPTPMREAAGATIDADEDQWRRLTGDGMRDLLPLTQDRMIKLAHFLWESNLIANRLIEVPLAYLLSQGVKWRVKDDDAQKVLDRHWRDGLNAYDIKLPKKVRELALFGEQCYPVFRNESNGFVRLGYLDPGLIATVITDPDNREQPIGIVTKKNAKGIAKRYRIIVNVPESAFAETAQKIRATLTDGECFYFRVNDLCSTTRGRSDLLAQMDWLDQYDQFLFGEVDRARATRSYFYDVTLTGASPDDVAAKAKAIASPRPGAVRVHNENEAWKVEAPELTALDVSTAAKLFRNHMLGGSTIPEHWFGGAADVNRATGDSMTEPTEKMLDMRRNYVGYLLLSIAVYVLRSNWQALDRELKENEQEVIDTLILEWPSMTSKDTSKYAAALQQVVAGCAMAMADGILSRETALRIIAAMADELGVQIDIEAELQTAQAEYAARGGNSLDGMNLTPPPDPTQVPQGEPAPAA